MNRGWIWILFIVLLVLIGLLLFAIDLPRIASDDMAPNIRKGDLLLACRVCGEPRRGDVVLFSPPQGKGTIQLRRVVGLPGDRISVHRGQIHLNGHPLEDDDAGIIRLSGVDPESPQPRAFQVAIEKNGEHTHRIIRDLTVSPASERAPEQLTDSYFLAADRRTLARDSRDYGPVPRASVRSIALRVIKTGDSDPLRQTRVP
jgi:signal peptidase I